MGKFTLEVGARSRWGSDTFLLDVNAPNLQEAKKEVEKWLLKNSKTLEYTGDRYYIETIDESPYSTDNIRVLHRDIWEY
jgi:hypothetical protein